MHVCSDYIDYSKIILRTIKLLSSHINLDSEYNYSNKNVFLFSYLENIKNNHMKESTIINRYIIR